MASIHHNISYRCNTTQQLTELDNLEEELNLEADLVTLPKLRKALKLTITTE